MKLKQYLTLGIGVAVGFGVSVVGVSYASKNITKSVKLITSEQAKSIMLNKVPGANFIEFSYDGDDMKPKYDGTLIKGDNEYEIDVDAKTGQIIKCEKEVIAISNNNANQNTSNNATTNTQQNTTANNNASATSTSNTNTNTNKNNTTTSSNKTNTTTSSSSYIGSSKAKSIMLNKVPGATVKSFSFDNDGTPEYDGELIKDGYEYDISVDAKTGAIREFSKERIDGYTSTSNTNTNTNKNNTTTSSNKTNTTTSSSSYISSSKAKSIMLNKVPGATVKSFSFDNDSTPEYDGELIKDGYEYDISVDARTGAIKEFSKERIDRYDDDKYDNDYDDDDRYDDDRYDNDYDDDDDRYDD